MNSDLNCRANSFFLATAAAMAALCAALYTFGATDQSSQLIRVYLCIAGALVLQMLLYHGLVWLHRRGLPSLPALRWGAAVVGAVVFAAGLAALVSRFPVDGVWTGFPAWLMLGAIVVFAVMLWPWLTGTEQKTQSWLPVAGIYLFAIFSYAAVCYVPNLLNGSGHQIHHVTAVTQSIYNAAFSEPYTIRTTGMYGHYAIFFWPFLHLFGHKPQTVALLLALCGVITQTLLAAILLKTVRSRAVAALALLASACVTANMETAYLQTFPLRQLWPLAILLYALHCVDKGGFSLRRMAAGYLLCCLAIVWNTDSGLVATAAFSLFIWLWGWRRQKPYARSMWKVYLQTVAGSAAAVAGMMAIVNLYNLLCGGPLILRACFYPLLGGQGYTQGLATNLLDSGGGISWLLPILLFSGCILLGLTVTSWLPIAPDRQAEPRFFLALFGVMGVGQSYYYFNRALAGAGCIQLYQILCMAVLASLVLPAAKESLQGRAVWQGALAGVGGFMTVALCGLSLAAVIDVVPVLSQRIETGTYSMQSLLDVAAEVEAKVPQNTYALGYFTQEIYAQLGWDPGYHERDVSDIQCDIRAAKETNDETALAMLADVNSQNAVLIHPWQMGAIQDNNELVPEFGIPESEPVVYYCSRNVQIPSAFSTENLGKNSLPIYQTKATGINRREKQYNFETVSQADLLLAADAIHEKGFVLRVDTDDELFSSNGQEQFTIEVLLDGTSVGTLDVQAARDPQHLEMTAPASAMPAIPEDGLYRVELVCHTSEEVSESTVMYYLTYAGAPAE